MGNKITNIMNKFNKDKKIILDHFNKTIKKHEKGAKAVSWGSKDSQFIRFKILSEIGDLNNKTILDVGCGLGDFYGFLTKDKNLKLKGYLGIDITRSMIAKARKKYPKAKFEIRDLLEELPEEPFDYVFESGIFNLKSPNWEKFTYAMLKKMYKISKIGVGVNFLSTWTPFKRDNTSAYADPCKILKFIHSHLTSRVILRQDYRPNDFTIFLYKD